MLNLQPLTKRGSLPLTEPMAGPVSDRTTKGKTLTPKQKVLDNVAAAPHLKGFAAVSSKTTAKTVGVMSKTKSSESNWAESEWNPAIFETVVEQYQSRIYRFIYAMVNEAELAHDLTQDTFMSAYKNLCKRAEERQNLEEGLLDEESPGSNGTNNMSAWLYTIARNAALSEMRRRKVVRFFSFWQRSETGSEDEVDSTADTAIVEAGGNLEARTALRDELDRAMNQVGRDRLTALLLHMDGFSYKEICQITGDSLSSVKSQIFRAKDSLRRTLAAQNQQYEAYLSTNPNTPAEGSEGGKD